MDKTLFSLIFLFLASFLYSQNVYDTDLFFENAANFIENQDFEQALDELAKIDPLDPRYMDAVLDRVSILAESSDKPLEAKALLKPLYEEGRFSEKPSLYVAYGRLLQNDEAYEKSEEVYSAGEKLFPNYPHLIFNKGILHYNAGDKQKALNYIKRTIEINPDRSRAHYLLGVMALENGHLTEAFLAFLGYLSNAPEDDYAGEALSSLDKKLSQFYLEKSDIIFSESGDDFSAMEQILRNDLPLNKKYALKVDMDEKYCRHLQAIMEYAASHDIKDGFFERTYMPFLKSIAEKGLVEDFTYYTLVSQTDNFGRKLKKHKDEIAAFYESYILKDFWMDFGSRNIDHLGEQKNVVILIDEGVPSLIGEVVDEKKEGNFILLDKYGRKAAVINYVENIPQGEVVYYNPDGKVIERTFFKDGDRNGKSTLYNIKGEEVASATYKDGKYDGVYTYTYPLGGKECVERYKEGTLDGVSACFYPNGQKKLELEFIDGQLNGKKTFYHPTGDLFFEQNYKDGELNGRYVSYDYFGNINMDINLKDGVPENSYKVKDNFGKLSREFIYDGENYKEISFGPRQIKEHNYYEGDDFVKNEAFRNGKLTTEYTMDGDQMKEVKQYNDKNPAGKKSKLSPLVLQDEFGNTILEVNYKKGKREGKEKYFYVNGKERLINNYENGKQTGKVTSYHSWGSLDREYYVKDGSLHGEYRTYVDNKLKSLYHYKDGLANGPFERYYENGQISDRGFYINDNQVGKHYEYSRDGTMTQISEFVENLHTSSTFIHEDGSTNIINYVGINEPLSFENSYGDKLLFELKQGVIEGEYTVHESDGLLRFKGNYINGDNHGLAEYYYPNGAKRLDLEYKYGKKNGKADYYSPTGAKTTSTQYREGDEEYLEYRYYQDNKVIRTNHNYNDDLYGDMTYYNKAGDTLFVILYERNVPSAYKQMMKDGKMSSYIPLTNKKQTVKVVYNDGSPAFEVTFKDKLRQGPLTIWSKEGQKLFECQYDNGILNGTRKEFYNNGQLYKNQEFIAGTRTGQSTFYAPNGDKLIVETFKNDSYYGPYEIYENGVLKTTRIYENGNFIKVE